MLQDGTAFRPTKVTDNHANKTNKKWKEIFLRFFDVIFTNTIGHHIRKRDNLANGVKERQV